ncbi:hypothetical protein ECEC3734_05416 [Escherichia coli O145:H28]|nr:hypothetical protein ECEC3734_05416 [Escherichia coli O145:H28]
MGFPYLAFEKIQIAGCIITRPTNSLHECRFANGVHTANVKIIIMARFDIDTGGYPVQPRAKIAGCGFNLPDIGNPRFREPELKLYRRVIHRKTRDRRYLKIARCQFNGGGFCWRVNPEGGGGRFALLAITVNCPDRQGVFPRRQTAETVLCIRGDGGGHQTAVLTASTGQAQTEAHALHHPRRVPFRLCQILAVSGAHLHRQVLHCRWNNAVQGA